MKTPNNGKQISLEELEYLPYIVLPNLDYESQLKAINSLLSSHRKADDIISKDINEITNYLKNYTHDHGDFYNQYLHDERGERIHSSIYQSAAHSMSAIGMLAPFIESIFYQAFYGIRESFYKERELSITHPRWDHGDNDKWDCHYVWSKNTRRKDIVKGIIQLSEATGLLKHLPEDLEIMLTVLFSYRNKMFHCGFEWPIEERKKFSTRIKKEKWPANWFNFATSDNEPWVFYLSSDFITHCLKIADSIIKGIGILIKYEIEAIENQNDKKQ